VIPVNAMQRGERVKPNTYIRTLTELRKRFRGIRPDKNPTEILAMIYHPQISKYLEP
jgi:hypothetical protein